MFFFSFFFLLHTTNRQQALPPDWANICHLFSLRSLSRNLYVHILIRELVDATTFIHQSIVVEHQLTQKGENFVRFFLSQCILSRCELWQQLNIEKYMERLRTIPSVAIFLSIRASLSSLILVEKETTLVRRPQR